MEIRIFFPKKFINIQNRIDLRVKHILHHNFQLFMLFQKFSEKLRNSLRPALKIVDIRVHAGMIDDLFCPKFHTCCISLVKTHHRNFTHFAVKSRGIDIHKRSMQGQSPTVHKFQPFPVAANGIIQMIQIVCYRKFNTFDSHSCLLDNLVHLMIRQKMTDIYHNSLPG